MSDIAKIEGIGPANAEKLQAAGIDSVSALLTTGSTPQGREEIANQTGISSKLILEWVNRADLFRISGIGEEYADLLVAAGVDTVAELAQRAAENLSRTLEVTNEEKSLVRRLPTAAQVAAWVAQAKELPRLVTY